MATVASVKVGCDMVPRWVRKRARHGAVVDEMGVDMTADWRCFA